MRAFDEKKEFVDALQRRIKAWVVEVLGLCESLPANQVTRVINYQLIRSSTSTGANHRAAARARSSREFFAKMSIAIEEADESHYWLDIIKAKGIKCDQNKLDQLIQEIDEILKILSKARSTVKSNKQ